jgi:hypothetical protein
MNHADDDEDVVVLDSYEQEAREWAYILAHIHPRHQAQSKGLILAQYGDMYTRWCFGHQVVLDARMQLCFKPVTESQAAWATPALFSQMRLQVAIKVYMDAGVTLHRLRADLDAHFEESARALIASIFEDVELPD